MALRSYEINFDDNSVQTIEAQGLKAEGDWLVFFDGMGEVNRVRAAEVSSVNRVGIPKRGNRTSEAA